jgi:hypothetical protein
MHGATTIIQIGSTIITNLIMTTQILTGLDPTI